MTAQSKAELNRKARERMAAHRQTPEYREWLQRSREMRKQLKAKYRRDAGATPRPDGYHEQAVAKRAKAADQRAVREALASLHDAHVKRYACVMRNREKYAKRWLADPVSERARSARRKQALPDSYVAEQLLAGGFPADAIDAHVLELKREVIQFRRLSRAVRKAISQQTKEQEHEAIAQHA